jgi:transketolase
MSGYAASGPEDELFVHFGITPEQVGAKVRQRLRHIMALKI